MGDRWRRLHVLVGFHRELQNGKTAFAILQLRTANHVQLECECSRVKTETDLNLSCFYIDSDKGEDANNHEKTEWDKKKLSVTIQTTKVKSSDEGETID